ncbi:efflux RND transporter periplasmic adaptor subunit [Arundinibacter roseus]|uniref:Efflux RND transporter periplasmic adaptor subunit n=1 Tax=Arundinibacter roseus TaxID=2070510 RepID=A0A4R4K0Q7_9BACT|nr:efflux RND transporter periplasmic adaptor subunit [Arundinibacter roseus]TDB60800.1 efflux RND transporter periplasmic adaptor subunit [Arundinibacter roseus]
MKTNSIVVVAFATVLLLACSGENKDGLAAKQEELAKLKSEQSELNQKIKTLEAEVAQLDTTSQQQERVKSVVVSPILSQNFKHYVEVQGSVDAKNSVMVSPKSGGVVTAVYVKEGDNVRQGATIARVDDSILRESIEELKNQMTLAQTVYEKQARLWEQKIGTEIQYLQAKNNKEALDKKLSTLNTQLSQANIAAPISGVVDMVNVRVGEMASPGMPVVRLVNLGNLKVVAKVADSYAASVRKGDEVIIKFPDLNKEFNARITFVSTTVDPLSRTFTIEANLPSSSGIKPNMLAQVQINDASRSDALVIDQNLVQTNEKGQVVYVAAAEGDRKVAQARTIKTGLSYNGKVEILEGLKTGDQLITQGYQDVADGQLISY